MLASDPSGVTLLHICAERGYSELAKVICDEAPKLVFEADSEGNTPMHVVCDWDYLEVIKILCDTVDTQLALAKVASAVDSDDDDQADEMT